MDGSQLIDVDCRVKQTVDDLSSYVNTRFTGFFLIFDGYAGSKRDRNSFTYKSFFILTFAISNTSPPPLLDI
ncbi:hypothetical protein FLAG1_08118 [Fusarium langsethiae]|uniref:Uncharacterized protein n=1 Tax=Fusarium langsethiae TaxID=179993 RepID=A0A0N0V5W6_FUSLA|nr:hypothetical protein FLAG1_08118 [Fusarium langsethiae]